MTEAPDPRPEAPLDDIMLAMDVVDTLRQQQQLVEQELDEPARAQDLIERLRKIYAAQGIDVPDDILAQGVAALAEERFIYRPAPPSFATGLARIYVARRRWGAWLLAFAALAAVAYGTYRTQVVAPRAALSGELTAAHAAVLRLATVPEATDRADALFATARAALERHGYAAARAGLVDLRDLRHTLEQTYTVRVVNRPGQASGVWRVPDVNPAARNYYLIVEAVAPDGATVVATVRNEETGDSVSVKQWGVRVDEATFQAVAKDKQDDGIIQNDRVGEKRRGTLEPDYTIPTTGAAITRW
ncbi:MAG: DUF6384 family protein [Deinococcales bacterium]